jgi:hypothetical protein
MRAWRLSWLTVRLGGGLCVLNGLDKGYSAEAFVYLD